MATYKEIKGVTVQTLDSDPVLNVGTWSSGGSMGTGRRAGHGTGITTAALAAGGQTGPGGNVTVNSEQYNGTAWAETNNLNTARYGIGSFGTYTASIAASGYVTTLQTAVESWNGTSWSETAELSQARFYSGGSKQGTITAGIIFGGSDGSAENKTEIWNGVSWTEGNVLPTVRTYPAGMGTSTAALSTGAFQSPSTYPNSTDQWNGVSWTNLSVTQNTTRSVASSVNAGSTTSALIAGGQSPGATANTETWDGSSWTEVNNLATANETIIGAGSSSSDAWGSGGDSIQTTTEEWAFPPPTSTVLTEGDLFLSQGTTLKSFGKAAGIPSVAWSSGTNLPNPYTQDAGSGSSNTAALHFGGRESGSGETGKTQTYDGSTFTEVSDMGTARRYLLGSGTQTSTLAYGGYTTTAVATVEDWNGGSWTAGTNLNQARSEQKGIGKSATAALAIAGNPSSPSFKTEQWNGASWTEVAEMNTSRIRCGTAGTSTASLAFLGESPGDVEKKNEEWNGSTWTEIADLNTERYLCGSGGDGITDAMAFGGNGSLSAACEYWNGSSWAEINDLSTATYIDASAGHGSPSVMKMGGYTTTQVATTEEFTVTTATLSTVTVS